MTSLSYNAHDIRAWAEFSGDFNPIHFDLARAARLNLPAVPVHGMRVMLDIKSALFQRMMGPAGAARRDATGWLLYKAVLRSPVLCDERYTLEIEERRQGCHYALIDARGHDECVTGYMRAAPEPQISPGLCTDMPAAWRSFTLTGKQLAGSTSAFRTCANRHNEAWMLLDALLFGAALLDAGLFLQVAQSLEAGTARSADDLMRSATVLQTHHSTLISEDVQKLRIGADGHVGELDAIDCRIDAPFIDGNPAEGFVVQVSLDAYDRGALLVRTTVGLKIFR
jgi:hypothetical protein